MTNLNSDLKSELEKEYFLIGRRTFWGGLAGMLIAVGVVSFGAAKSAISTWSEATTLAKLSEAEGIADNLIANNRMLPEGAIVLLSKQSDCPTNYQNMSQFLIFVSQADDGEARLARQAAHGDSTFFDDKLTAYNSLTYTACLVQ